MIVRYRLISLVVFILFLVSCDPVNLTNNPITVSPQFSLPAPTTNDSGTPSSIAVLPTPTLKPGAAPDITPIAFAQEIVSAQFAEETLVAQYPHVCKRLISPRDFSPNGLWMVEFCYSDDEKSLILTISKRESRNLWKLHYRDYISVIDYLPDGGLSVVHWSNDEQYVYFNSYINTSGGECSVRGNVAEGGLGLFRLNLDTGDVVTILPPKDNLGWYGYSFSPTDRRLVYGAYASDFKILDINTGKLININPATNFSEGGGFLWSSNGLELVYSTVLYNEISEPIGYSLRLVDVQSGNEQILLDAPDTCFLAMSWIDDNVLQIEKDFGKALIEFNLHAKTIISETSTTP